MQPRADASQRPPSPDSGDEGASLRARIAQLAARRMVEELEDAEQAKRKAARALGAPPSARGLPDTEELRAALRGHLRRHGGAEHRRWLAARRRLALSWMRRLAAFRPYLVGPVLDASAAPLDCLELELFTDSAKDVELALLALGVDYRADPPDRPQGRVLQLIGFVDRDGEGDPAARAGGRADARLGGTAVLLRVCDALALRNAPPRLRDPGADELHPVERAGRADAAALERLLLETGAPPGAETGPA